LKNSEYEIELILLGEKYSDDNLQNQKRWKDIGGEIHWYNSLERFLKEDVIVIDAIFGTGLNQAPEGNYKSCIQKLNESGKKIISIDLPSGMNDGKQFDFNSIIKANFTLTFQFPKFAFLLPDSGVFAGDWEVMDIGLLQDGYLNEKPIAHFLTKEMIKNNFPKRDVFSHKGTFGHVCLIGGSYGKMGAMVLSAHACMKSGAGLITVVVPECGYDILQTILPEAMVRVSKSEFYLEEFDTGKTDYDAVGVGPGMGTEKATADALKSLIQNANVPLVMDADALNILAENKTWLHFLPAGSILTPHPGEFQRLVGKWDSAHEMIELQKEFTFKFQCIVVLKGAYTSITTPGGNLFFNSTGNPGLAKGGSGDTLTGIITSVCAQGFSTLEAALSGVCLHGLAAELALEENNEYA
jgi:NAD(P)H-hydrate epimerase